MELTVPLITLPAIVALILKAAIYAYTRLFRVARNIETRLFFLFLLALVFQNVAEIGVIYTVNVDKAMPYSWVKLFYVGLIVAISLLFHLATCIGIDEQRRIIKTIPKYVYLIAAALVVLVYTPWLIRDIAVLDYGIGYSATRIPGPAYVLFELYIVGVLVSVVGILFHGWRNRQAEKKRAKSGVLLVAIVPTVIVLILAVFLLHFGIKKINASVTTPITITYFLAVSAYGIHHRRFFDIGDDLEKLAVLRAQLENERKSGSQQDRRAHSAWIPTKTLDAQVAELETSAIAQALALCEDNQSKAAALLGMRPNTLHYKMHRYGLLSRRKRIDRTKPIR